MIKLTIMLNGEHPRVVVAEKYGAEGCMLWVSYYRGGCVWLPVHRIHEVRTEPWDGEGEGQLEGTK